MALVIGAIKQLEAAIPQIGEDNEAATALHEAIIKLRKHFPAEAVSPGIERTRQQQHMLQQRQEDPMMAILRMTGQQQQPPGGGPPGGTPMPPGAAAGGLPTM